MIKEARYIGVGDCLNMVELINRRRGGIGIHEYAFTVAEVFEDGNMMRMTSTVGETLALKKKERVNCLELKSLDG